jgi:hypothetical protein
MSSFIDAIIMQLTGNVKIGYKTPLKVGVEIETNLKTLLNEYNINVTWNRKCFCEKHDIEDLFKNVIRELRNNIYGDLYQKIMRLERYIYTQEDVKAKMEIRDIVHEIFG